ncbi:Imm8 family immunity protein [Deinococcus sp. Leaf326]|uniref:Imm8 family immunity protein n=1 Tax=Deinococcus sp. Leaf326 TaxID=1736338 RepID=UPI0009E7BBB5|nr:Imm8 family immunity protein [Deinococcus sp. Leaf326]
MKAELKGIVSTEFSYPFEQFYPEDERSFGMTVQLLVGPKGENSSEIFDLLICSPDWIKTEYAHQGYTWGTNILILLEYDFFLIKECIERYISLCAGENWADLAYQISKIGGWEFENYRPLIE